MHSRAKLIIPLFSLVFSCLFVVFNVPSVSAATRVFYDGFESGNTNLWGTDGTPCVVVASATDELVGPYGGSRMLRCNYDGNSSNKYQSLYLNTSNYTNELFLRGRFRADSNLRKDDTTDFKLLRFYQTTSTYHDLFSVAGHPGDSFTNACNASWSQTCPTYWGGDNMQNTSSWHTFEYYFHQSNGTIKVWYDNVLIRNDTGYNFEGVKWTEFSLGSNGVLGSSDTTNHWYVDDFEVFSDASAGTPASGSMANGDIAVSSTPDTTPPTSPTNLAASSPSQSSISVSWNPATDNIGVTGYIIERCQDSGCTDFTQVGTPTSSPFVDSGLTANTFYNYHVRAVDGAGNLSGWSNVVGVATQAPDTQAPTAPSNLQTSVVSSSNINLAWTASVDNVAVTNYTVERCTGSSCTTFTQIGTPTTNSYSDTGLSASTTYRYRVRATDAANNLSPYSNIASATTPEAPPVSDSLMLGLNFNEGTGTTTSDVSGHNNTGTLQNGTGWNTSGKYGNSLTFDGNDDIVDIGNPTTLNLASNFTLSAWVYPTTLSGDRDVITKVGSTSDYHLQITNSQAQIGFSVGGNWYSHTTSGVSLPLNAWTHIAGVFNDTTNTLSVFVNGTSAGQTSVTASPEPSTNPVRIGMGWSGQNWNGRIDDVRISNKALTQTEIQSDMNTPLAQPTSTQSCNTVTTSNFSQAAYNSYGAPFDAFQTSTNLVNTQCNSADTHTINLTTGVTGDTTRIIYTKGYWYDAVTTAWRQYTGTCTGALNGEWCQGSVSAIITDANVSTANAANPTYLVGMTCSVQGGSWKCGCRDTSCTNFSWQIQGAGQ